MAATTAVKRPIDLVRMSLDERVFVKCRGGRTLRGKLHAFDEHMNLVMGEVEETITRTSTDEATGEEVTATEKRAMEMVFVRGDVVVLLSPPPRAG